MVCGGQNAHLDQITRRRYHPGQRNQHKSAVLYKLLDDSGLYRNRVEHSSRSWMNVPFNLIDQKLESCVPASCVSRRLRRFGWTPLGWWAACQSLQCHARGVLSMRLRISCVSSNECVPECTTVNPRTADDDAGTLSSICWNCARPGYAD